MSLMHNILYRCLQPDLKTKNTLSLAIAVVQLFSTDLNYLASSLQIWFYIFKGKTFF